MAASASGFANENRQRFGMSFADVEFLFRFLQLLGITDDEQIMAACAAAAVMNAAAFAKYLLRLMGFTSEGVGHFAASFQTANTAREIWIAAFQRAGATGVLSCSLYAMALFASAAVCILLGVLILKMRRANVTPSDENVDLFAKALLYFLPWMFSQAITAENAETLASYMLSTSSFASSS